ncbi:MAG: glutathione S-transferase N-terminal domain-containing protein, partial [Thermofilaceae archaeon]
ITLSRHYIASRYYEALTTVKRGGSVRYGELPPHATSNPGIGVEEVTLFVDGGEESREAEELLQRKGLKYRKIDVSSNGLRGWLLFEYGTAKVPLLVMGGTVLVGLEEIKNFCSK